MKLRHALVLAEVASVAGIAAIRSSLKAGSVFTRSRVAARIATMLFFYGFAGPMSGRFRNAR